MCKNSNWDWNSKQGLSEYRAAKWQTEGRINELQLLRNLIKSYIKPGILLKDFVLTLIKVVSH